jgi:DNA-binding MarR family transcriptional regulator
MAATRSRNVPRVRHPRRLEEVVFEQVLRTADRLLWGELQVIRAAELTFPQYNVLRILRGARPHGLSCGEIAARLVNRDPDVTRLLDRLENRGLAERYRDDADRRVILSRITGDGERLLAELDGPVQRVHVQQLEHMTRRDLERLASLLETARTPRADTRAGS